jgi:hypothetical protein
MANKELEKALAILAEYEGRDPKTLTKKELAPLIAAAQITVESYQ